ncbi:hypothetical protein RZE82_04410 [Mollicutes bacterium LVI A0039]|nr:hypothetical protein RZE82_04410 [Mollicutes bacterium LVI A0039]
MGENQGMIWIILGVIVVGAVIIVLGNVMKSSVDASTDEVVTQANSSLGDGTVSKS